MQKVCYKGRTVSYFNHSPCTLEIGWVPPAKRVIKFHDAAYYLSFPHLVFCNYYGKQITESGVQILFSVLSVFACAQQPENIIEETHVDHLPLTNLHFSGRACLGGDNSYLTGVEPLCSKFWNTQFTVVVNTSYYEGLERLEHLTKETIFTEKVTRDNLIVNTGKALAIAEKDNILLLPDTQPFRLDSMWDFNKNE